MGNKWVFRGWDAVGEKGWVYGDLVHNQKVTVDGLEPRVMVGGYEVVPESVGICTGLQDSEGVDIYEDDVMCIETFHVLVCYSVAAGGFQLLRPSERMWRLPLDIGNAHTFHVVGNVYQNGELLNVENHG